MSEETSNDIKLPETDSERDRLVFYAKLAHETNSNKNDIDGIGKKVDALSKALQTATESVTKMMTTARITMIAVTIIWSVFGGVGGFMLNRTIMNYDRFMVQYEKMSTMVANQKTQLENLQVMTPTIESMRRAATEQQRRIDELEDKVGQLTNGKKTR